MGVGGIGLLLWDCGTVGEESQGKGRKSRKIMLNHCKKLDLGSWKKVKEKSRKSKRKVKQSIAYGTLWELHALISSRVFRA